MSACLWALQGWSPQPRSDGEVGTGFVSRERGSGIAVRDNNNNTRVVDTHARTHVLG